MSVNVLAPILRRCAVSFEKAISIRFRSGLYGGKNRNQHPASRMALAAAAFLCVAKLSKMTTVPGSSSGTRTCVTYAADASPSIAPLMTHGAINSLAPRPAMKVCVPHDPNGAAIINR